MDSARLKLHSSPTIMALNSFWLKLHFGTHEAYYTLITLMLPCNASVASIDGTWIQGAEWSPSLP
eukprot:356812-Chlamydomonas_euryale.AAC.2